jgi:hypothetical protein
MIRSSLWIGGLSKHRGCELFRERRGSSFDTLRREHPMIIRGSLGHILRMSTQSSYGPRNFRVENCSGVDMMSAQGLPSGYGLRKLLVMW